MKVKSRFTPPEAEAMHEAIIEAGLWLQERPHNKKLKETVKEILWEGLPERSRQ